MSVFKPCRFLRVLFASCYHELRGEFQFVIHQFKVMCHVLPILSYSDHVHAYFSREYVPFESKHNNTMPQTQSSTNKWLKGLNGLYQWISGVIESALRGSTSCHGDNDVIIVSE